MSYKPENGDQDGTGLFRWSDGTVVVFAEHTGGIWFMSRGWRSHDRLGDIRRWRFQSPRLLIGQLRRLVRDATGDFDRADGAVADLERWIAEVSNTEGAVS